MNQHTGITFNANSWSNSSIVQNYKEEIAYDANGNILRYLRNGTATGGGLNMDSLTYHYTAGTNKLDHVRDAIGDANYTVDIDNQSSGNYEYDAIGNLVKDTKEGISNIEWTVYGKINSITKTNGTSISYAYDAAGNRVQKTVVATGAGTKNTFYVRDAQGNVMGVYADSSSVGLTLNEQHVYGSSRLGLYNWGKAIAANAPVPQWQGGSNYTPVYDSILPGSISFELSNHLGNVLSTISDKKIGIPLNDTVVNSYIAEVLSQNDYYPFGMMMPGRTYSAGSGYRYGFNGKENDNEVKGEGNQQDYGMRIYDPRLGKFLSVDPIAKSYPMLTPYQFASNMPLNSIDLDGLEAMIIINENKDGKATKTPRQLNEKEIKALIPTLPSELSLTPGVGTLTITKERFSSPFVENYDDFVYDPDTKKFNDEQYVQKFTNPLSQAGDWFNKKIYPLFSSGGYGAEASYTLAVGASGSTSTTTFKPINGEVRFAATGEVSQSRVGTFNLTGSISLTGSINTSVGQNNDFGKLNTSPKPSLNFNKKPEVFVYLFSSSSTELPTTGSTVEQTTSVKINYFKFDLTKTRSGTTKLRFGFTSNPGLEFKTSDAKAKTTVVAGSKSVNY